MEDRPNRPNRPTLGLMGRISAPPGAARSWSYATVQH